MLISKNSYLVFALNFIYEYDLKFWFLLCFNFIEEKAVLSFTFYAI